MHAGAHASILARTHARTRAHMHAIWHLCRIARKHASVQAQVQKGSDIALHFTDIRSCQLILNSMGIRASSVGQLGGGVSVCLRTITGFDWGDNWQQFSMAIGKALWGSKWYGSHEPHACKHASMHARAHTHAHAHTHACMHAGTHARTHARTQTSQV